MLKKIDIRHQNRPNVFVVLFQICIGFLVFVIIGWGPYGMFMCWSMITDSTEVSSLAASLPPLFAKGCTALYPIGYLLSSEKIRDGVLGGYLDEPAKKEK